MSRSFDEIVSALKFLRMSLLPPYCENLDEDEKDVDDYAIYFRTHLQQSTDATRRYRDAIDLYESHRDNQTVTELLIARAQFVASFPFCVDELVNLNDEELGPYRDYMIKAYQADAATGFLRKTVSEYLVLLEGIGGDLD